MKLNEHQRYDLGQFLVQLEAELQSDPLLTTRTRYRLILASIRLRHYLDNEDVVK